MGIQSRCKKDVYETYGDNQNVSQDTAETASLDNDEVNSYCPETITFNVYNYSDESPISTSNAVVSVTFGSDTFTFRPPNQSGRTWTVFTIENGTLVPCTGTCIQ